jgi:hypothetical protein
LGCSIELGENDDRISIELFVQAAKASTLRVVSPRNESAWRTCVVFGSYDRSSWLIRVRSTSAGRMIGR